MTWTINGVDPRVAYGLSVSEVQGWRDAVRETLPAVSVPGTPGLTATSTTRIVEPRRLIAPGVVTGVGATLALRAADARTKLDRLFAALAKANLVVVMNDSSTRQLIADCEQIVVPPVAASMIADQLLATVHLLCRDPYYYDTALTTMNGNVASNAALGTAPSRPTMTITFAGAVTTLVYSLTNAANTVTFASISLTGPFVAADVLVVDCAARTVTLNGVLRPDLISAGDFFAMDVALHGDYATSTWPTVRTNGPAYNLAYRKAYR
jgi:hypothetical protein